MAVYVNGRLYTQTQASGVVIQTTHAKLAADTSTTATTYATATLLLSASMTTSENTKVYVNFEASMESTDDDRWIRFALKVDGTLYSGTANSRSKPSEMVSVGLVYPVEGLAAGAHTFSIYWWTEANTASIRPVTKPEQSHACLVLQEVQ